MEITSFLLWLKKDFNINNPGIWLTGSADQCVRQWIYLITIFQWLTRDWALQFTGSWRVQTWTLAVIYC